MSTPLESLPKEIQDRVKQKLANDNPPVSLQEQYQYATLVLDRLQKLSGMLDDMQEYAECLKMIKTKKREIKDIQEAIEFEITIKERKALQVSILAKALEL